MADSNQELLGLQKNLQNVGTNVGFLERGFLKMHKTITNTPVVKQMVQLKRFAANLKTVYESTEELNEAEREANNEKMKSVPTLTLIVGLMTQYGLAAKLANKGTTATTMALFRLASMLLFLGGIFTTIVLLITLFTAAFADANSPLLDMLSNIPVVGEAIAGFQLILGGEDGEGGITNAVNIFAAALLVAAPLLLLFGAPVAILGATLVAAIGMFRWVKNATDSFAAGIIAALAVITGGLAIFATYFAVFGSGVSAALGAFLAPILAGISLFLGGITLMWLSLTGEISYWWGVIGSIFTVIGAAILYGVAFGFAAISLPVVLIAAAAAAIVFTIVKYWDEIKAFFIAVWDWCVDLGATIWGGLVSGWNTVTGWLGAARDWIGGVISSAIDLVVGLWNGFWSTLGGIKDAIVGWFVGIAVWIYNKFMAGVAFVGRVRDMFKQAILNAMAMVLNPISTFWNNNIKGIVPKMTVPDWVPGLGGKSFGPFPGGLKMFAEGGLVNRPTLGMVGEAGPEAIIPLRSGNVPVQITGRQSEAEMVKAIQELSQQVAANGNTFNISVDASGVVAASDRAKAELAKELAEAVFKQIVSNIPGTIGDTASRAWYS